MSNTKINVVFINALKGLLISVFKIVCIGFSWGLRLVGTLCTKSGEAIERILLKRTSV